MDDNVRGNPRDRRGVRAGGMGRRLGDFSHTPFLVSYVSRIGNQRGLWDPMVCAVHGSVFLHWHMRVLLYVPFEQTLPVEIWWLHDTGITLDPYFMPWKEVYPDIRHWLISLGHVSAAEEPNTAHFISRLQPQPPTPALAHSNGHTHTAAPDQGVGDTLRMVPGAIVSAGLSDLADPRHEPISAGQIDHDDPEVMRFDDESPQGSGGYRAELEARRQEQRDASPRPT